jgi:hypothetical protein
MMNIKQTLKKFNFEEKISLKCIYNDDVDCLVLIDGIIQKEKITKLFKECPDVYEYSKDQTMLEFADINLENMETLPVCFEFDLNKDGSSSQLIVDTKDEVYIYDNISSKPKEIKYMNDIALYFDDKNSEVKDAF